MKRLYTCDYLFRFLHIMNFKSFKRKFNAVDLTRILIKTKYFLLL